MIWRRGRWHRAVASAALALVLGGTRSEAATAGASDTGTANSARPGPAEAASAQGASADVPALDPADEMILEVRTDKWILTDQFPGYSTSRGGYLPLGDLSRLLDLAISVDAEAGRAEGWFLEPQRTFRLDIGSAFVETRAGRKPLQPGDAIPLNGDIYVRTDLLPQWFPLQADIVLAKQQVALKLGETFPFEAKMQRAESRTGLGFRRNARVEYPRQETLYEMLSSPAFDLNIQTSTGLKTETTSQYDVRASGDLAWMNADLFVGGSKDHPLDSARLTLRRRDPDRQLLGPLHLSLVELGDTSSISQPIGMRSRTGRGFTIGNAPLDNESVFDRIDLRGELPIGYEVELYRNDILIGSVDQAVDGRYEFPQVPLEFGLNVLRLVFFGPHGEKREEVRRINAGEGRLGTGEFQFSASAVQQDKLLIPLGNGDTTPQEDAGGIRAAASAQYGLSPSVTLVGSLSSFTNINSDGRVNQGILGIRTGIAGAALQADAAVQGSGSWAFQSGLAGRVLGTSFVLQHAEFSGEFVDEVRGGGLSGTRRVTQARLDRGIDLGDHVIAANLVLERSQRNSGDAQLSAALRTSTNLFRWSFSNMLNYRGGSGEGSIDGAIEASGSIHDWDVRAGLGYNVRPASALRDFSLTLDRELGADLKFRAGVIQQLSSNRTTRGVLSLTKRVGFMDVAADAQYDTASKALLIGSRLSFSIGRGAAHWGVGRPGLARGGSVMAIAFRDLDGDGIRDPEEEGLSGIGFRGGSGEDRKTDKSGRVLLTGLGDGRPAQVTFESETLSDPYLRPSTDGIEVVPRPGRTHVAMFPVTAVSEVEGKAFFERGDSSRAVANVNLQLIDSTGKVVETARTEYDGFFLFEKVRAGDYTVRIDPEQAGKLKVSLAETINVKATPQGGVVDGLTVKVVSNQAAGAPAAAAAN